MTIEDFKSNPRTMYLAEEYERLSREEEDATSMSNDPDMKEIVEEEMREEIEKMIKEKTEEEVNPRAKIPPNPGSRYPSTHVEVPEPSGSLAIGLFLLKSSP